MVTKFYLTLSLLTLLTTASAAETFILSIHADHDYTRLHSRSAFHLFSDGKYVLETNTGINGLCTSNEVGKFVGQLNARELEDAKKSLASGVAQCQGITNSSCTSNSDSKEKGITWWLNDFSGGTKKTIFFKNDEKTPNGLTDIISKITMLQKNGKDSLVLMRNADNSYALKYAGHAPLKLSLSLKNFLIVSESGVVQALTDVSKSAHLHGATLVLNPGDSTNFKLDLKMPKDAKNWRLIYDSSLGDNPIGHSDIQFSPCLILN